VGNRYQELIFLGQMYAFFALGDWDDVEAFAGALPDEITAARQAAYGAASILVTVAAHRGRLEDAERLVSLMALFADSADAQERANYAMGASRLHLARGEPAEGLRMARIALGTREGMGTSQEYWKESLVNALEGALALEDVSGAEDLLGLVDQLLPGRRTQFLQAQSFRFRARLAALSADADAERLFKHSSALFRELAMPFYRAVSQLEHAEWLVAQDRTAEVEPLLTEARETFERLKAAPWLERADHVGVGTRVPA
jgi:hypothetical protein